MPGVAYCRNVSNLHFFEMYITWLLKVKSSIGIGDGKCETHADVNTRTYDIPTFLLVIDDYAGDGVDEDEQGDEYDDNGHGDLKCFQI